MATSDIKRIIRAGVLTFFRNGFVSFSAVLVMTVALFAIGSLLFSNILVEVSLNDLKEKVDINVYFLTSAKEADIVILKTQLEQLPEVKSVTYISRDEALELFRERHADFLTLQALDELGENPLGASLDILAQETSPCLSMK